MALSTPSAVLMCAPDHFAVFPPFSTVWEREAWERAGRQDPIDYERARHQWNGFRLTLMRLGVRSAVLHGKQTPRSPDQTFVRDSGIVCGSRFIPARFKYERRRGEICDAVSFFLDRGLSVLPIPALDGDLNPVYFEGGDARWGNAALFLGYGMRSNKKGVERVAAAVRQGGFTGDILLLELVAEEFYHLDTCLVAIGDTVLYYPPALTSESADELRRHCRARNNAAVAVDDEDALRFFCCSVPVLRSCSWSLIVPQEVASQPLCAPQLKRFLERRGITLVGVLLDEFKKSGAGADCLILPIPCTR
ncbi:MAG: hypothetical protein HYS74_00020 [Parcubacteria group bacterium]|nr:hypothetical protein [Parcubacteria group bacterium]